MKRSVLQQVFKSAALTISGGLLFTANLFAAGPPVASEASNPLALVLLVIIIALLLIMGLLAYVLLGAAEISLKRSKESNMAASVAKALFVTVFCMFSTAAFAGDAGLASAAQEAVSTSINGLSKSSYYILLSIIGLEVIVILAMLYYVRFLLAIHKPALVPAAKEAQMPWWKKWWMKINNFKAPGEVSDLGHDYDGIRELDNRLPPWWLYGFIGCIIFAIVYLYRFEVVHTGPSSLKEYEIAMADAEIQKEEYLKHAANNIDENSVILMIDATALAEGKKIFTTNCVACHGAEAQGGVGPNLTDDYWLHNGGVKDVFKTIKYGVPEKGMKSWKDDFSPAQMAQLASYIKSLHGSKPANPKEPQGTILTEDVTAASDTTRAETKFAAK